MTAGHPARQPASHGASAPATSACELPPRWLDADCEPGLVSVLVPTCNRAHLLGPTLGSLLNQTYETIETIVVDDGSTDDTPAVLETWQRRFDSQRGWRLTVLRQENRGAPAARNQAAQACRGQYLNFFDDDDLMSEDKIAAQIAALAASGAAIAFGPHQLFRQQGERFWLGLLSNAKPPELRRGVLRAWLAGWDWALQASLLTRQFVMAIGPWNEQLRRGQDLEYKVRCVQQEPEFAYAPGGTTFVRRHAGSVSHDASGEAVQSVLASLALLEQVCHERLDEGERRTALAGYWGRRAIKFYEEGAAAAGRFCLNKTGELDPTWHPPGLGSATRLAFRLGGVPLLGAVGRLRKTLGRLVAPFVPGRSAHCVDRLPLTAKSMSP